MLALTSDAPFVPESVGRKLQEKASFPPAVRPAMGQPKRTPNGQNNGRELYLIVGAMIRLKVARGLTRLVDQAWHAAHDDQRQ